jgi:hypothetical protein
LCFGTTCHSSRDAGIVGYRKHLVVCSTRWKGSIDQAAIFRIRREDDKDAVTFMFRLIDLQTEIKRRNVFRSRME